MPSPCEVVPDPVSVVLMDVTGPGVSRRGMPSRVIPVIAGGTFAGVLLILLGCTPLFQPASAKAGAQQATIVTTPSDGLVVGAPAGATAKSKPATVVNAAKPAPASSAGGVAAIASASSTRGGLPTESQADSHRFTIDCNPLHDNEDSSAVRPEDVALQGIMAGQSSRAALLDGVLYREGDHFGSHVCPWTIATIDAASVRIEKAFGDRTCGVTIKFQQDKTAQARGRATAIR